MSQDTKDTAAVSPEVLAQMVEDLGEVEVNIEMNPAAGLQLKASGFIPLNNREEGKEGLVVVTENAMDNLVTAAGNLQQAARALLENGSSEHSLLELKEALEFSEEVLNFASDAEVPEGESVH